MKKIFLISFKFSYRGDYPTCYELVYAENYDEALTKLANKYRTEKLYEFENCTIL